MSVESSLSFPAWGLASLVYAHDARVRVTREGFNVSLGLGSGNLGLGVTNLGPGLGQG